MTTPLPEKQQVTLQLNVPGKMEPEHQTKNTELDPTAHLFHLLQIITKNFHDIHYHTSN